MGRIKTPVPNVRGGGVPIGAGLVDPGADDPYAEDDPYANYGMPGQPPQMARGGVVNKPTVAVVGERGPEAVVKLRPRMSYRRKEQ